jgi:hypothetical protein
MKEFTELLKALGEETNVNSLPSAFPVKAL